MASPSVTEVTVPLVLPETLHEARTVPSLVFTAASTADGMLVVPQLWADNDTADTVPFALPLLDEPEHVRIMFAEKLLGNFRTWLWAALSAAASGTVAFLLLDPLPATVVTVVAFGAGALGYIDQRTKLILNQHSLALSAVLVGALLMFQVSMWPEPVLLTAVLAAAGVFLTMVLLWFITGFASGGDIKLAPVIAAGLAVVSPLTPFLWLMLAFILSMFVTAVNTITRGPKAGQTVPMAPLMAAAVPIAVAGTAWVYTLMLMPLGAQ
jgi:hypothetical protein